MSRNKFVFKQKIIKISERQQLHLNELMELGFFPSEAEVFREGLSSLHHKLIENKKNYLDNLTINENYNS